MHRNLLGQQSSAASRGDKEAVPVEAPISMSLGDLSEADGVPDASTSVNVEHEKAKAENKDTNSPGAKRRAPWQVARCPSRRKAKWGVRKKSRRQVEQTVCSQLLPGTPPAVRKRLSPASTEICVTYPLPDETMEVATPSGSQQSGAVPAPSSGRSQFEMDSASLLYSNLKNEWAMAAKALETTVSAPVAKTLAPVGTRLAPVSTTSPPVANTSAPVSTTSALVENSSVLVRTTSVPVGTLPPVANTSALVETTSAPVGTTLPPVANTSAPVETLAPLSTTSAPVPETLAPVRTVGTTLAPVSTSSPPVANTSALVETTLAPVSTTSALVSETLAPMGTIFLPYTDDFGNLVRITSSSDPNTFSAIPGTSFGVSEGELKAPQVYRTDQDQQSIIFESIDRKDDDDYSGSEHDGDIEMSEGAFSALYGSDCDSSGPTDSIILNRQVQPDSVDDDFLEQNAKLMDLANSLTGFEDGAIESVDPTTLSSFTWSSDFKTFKGKKEIFRGKAGPTSLCTDPLSCYLQFWDEGIVSKIVEETNRYAKQQLERIDLTKSSRFHRWIPTNVNEMYLLFSIFMLQSVFPLTNETEYWRSRSEFTNVSFSKIMSYDRFIVLKSFLHFRDNDTVAANNHEDSKLAKLQPIIDHLSDKFSTLYIPGQNIALDESLTGWKGKLSWLQYIQTKSARLGIKSYELCESGTGYMWKFYIYTGKFAIPPTSEERAVLGPNETAGATTLMVLKLMEGILDKGYTLFMDNFYNCPSLARYLKSKGTDCVGTLRTNRKHVPKVISDTKKEDLSRGEMISLHSGDVTVLSWKDMNKVSMISTYHDNSMGKKGEAEKSKPVVVLDYNMSMGGVDTKDQRLSSFKMERIRNLKWYRKMFRRLMNASVLNAYIIYKSSVRTIHASPKYLTHREFRYDVANNLIKTFKTFPQPTVVALVRLNSKVDRPIVANNHFVVLHELGEGKKRMRKRCELCKNKTVHYCSVCKCSLCVPDCFIKFHTSRGPIK